MSIVLYVLKGCPYCNNALMLLKENNIKYKAIVVEDKDKEKYKKINKMKTFPQIFINVDGNNYFKLGGNDDLVETMQIVKTIINSNVSLDAVYYLHKIMAKKTKK
jgi:glutaredoxin